MGRASLYWLLAGLGFWCYSLAAQAQATMGDGLRGDYYQGLSFDHRKGTRLDVLLDFDWQEAPPLRGMLADYFTVRWMGWLVPPVTGRYLLRLTVDDAVRLWLDDKQLIDEWRGQPLGYYEATVELQAGHAYRLRLDYAQYSLRACLQLAWERPRHAEALGSWRNLWNVATKLQVDNRQREVVPTRYLFSYLPAPRRTLPPAPPRPTKTGLLTNVPVRPPSPPTPTKMPPTPKAVHLPPAWRPTPPKLAALALHTTGPHAARRVALSGRRRLADTPAERQALTLRVLYFEQGKADLPLPMQASLDTLARALRHYASLRLEVQGHTDNQGDPELNRQLSQRRAEAVCHYLAERGIASARLQPLGLGGTQPMADNSQPAERPRNRRVVLRPLPQGRVGP